MRYARHLVIIIGALVLQASFGGGVSGVMAQTTTELLCTKKAVVKSWRLDPDKHNGEVLRTLRTNAKEVRLQIRFQDRRIADIVRDCHGKIESVRMKFPIRHIPRRSCFDAPLCPASGFYPARVEGGRTLKGDTDDAGKNIAVGTVRRRDGSLAFTLLAMPGQTFTAGFRRDGAPWFNKDASIAGTRLWLFDNALGERLWIEQSKDDPHGHNSLSLYRDNELVYKEQLEGTTGKMHDVVYVGTAYVKGQATDRVKIEEVDDQGGGWVQEIKTLAPDGTVTETIPIPRFSDQQHVVGSFANQNDLVIMRRDTWWQIEYTLRAEQEFTDNLVGLLKE